MWLISPYNTLSVHTIGVNLREKQGFDVQGGSQWGGKAALLEELSGIRKVILGESPSISYSPTSPLQWEEWTIIFRGWSFQMQCFYSSWSYGHTLDRWHCARDQGYKSEVNRDSTKSVEYKRHHPNNHMQTELQCGTSAVKGIRMCQWPETYSNI